MSKVRPMYLTWLDHEIRILFCLILSVEKGSTFGKKYGVRHPIVYFYFPFRAVFSQFVAKVNLLVKCQFSDMLSEYRARLICGGLGIEFI